VILSQLEIQHFRNIENASLSPHPALNLISGQNGAGKSSILEAIQCLATGHSFRTRKPRELISHTSESYQITSTFSNDQTQREHRAGLIRRRDGTLQLRFDYEDIKSQAEITRHLPVKAITPDSHRLVQEGPDERRQFLDWGLFHVEPAFHQHWKQYRRALSQRNQLLRENGSDKDIKVWTDPFVYSAQAIHEARTRYVQSLTEIVNSRQTNLKTRFHVELSYRCGWDNSKHLAHLLDERLPNHRKMKTTTDGPHRADIHLTTDNIPIKHVLSRGQQKLLVYLLHLSQLDLLRKITSRQAIILCDDLISELDEEATRALLADLFQIKSQVYITGIDLSTLQHQSHAMFHMEHGLVKKGL